MTYIEAPLQTIERFIPSWRCSNPSRLEEEIISTFNETHRKPDEYKFKFQDGGLVDFKTGNQINIDTSTYLGKKDEELLIALNSWVSENETGVAIWISPSFESAYPCNKITMYRLNTNELGEKTTFNVTVLFDTPQAHTLEIASEINPVFAQVDNPEILRNKLFVMNEEFNFTDLLKLANIHQNHAPTPSVESINYIVDLIYSGIDPKHIAWEMNQRGLIGENSVSCAGGTSTSALESNSLILNLGSLEDEYGSLIFICPKCGSANTRPFGKLISNCQHCGGDVRC